MLRHRCLFPNCGELLPESGYCEKHREWAENNRTRPFANARRSNEGLYQTAEWRALRRRVVDAPGGRCEVCGRFAKSLEAHHIMPPRGNRVLFFSEANLLAVCGECHKRITQGEIIERSKNK